MTSIYGFFYGFYQDYVLMPLYNNVDLLLYWKADIIIGRFQRHNLISHFIYSVPGEREREGKKKKAEITCNYRRLKSVVTCIIIVNTRCRQEEWFELYMIEKMYTQNSTAYPTLSLN